MVWGYLNQGGSDSLNRTAEAEENQQLKQLVADLNLDKQMLQDVLKKSSNGPSVRWKGCEVIELNVQIDHIHLVISIPPKVSISELMGTLKGKLAIKLFKNYSTGHSAST